MGKVPGTFKNQPPQQLTRMLPSECREAEAHCLAAGCLYVRSYWLGDCRVIVSRDPATWDGRPGFSWHLSISHHGRYPSWDEIKTARYLAPELEDVRLMAQLLPKLDHPHDWVDVHPNVFHLHQIVEAEDG